MSRIYPGEDLDDAADRLYEDWEQRMIDDREEEKQIALSIQDAFLEGQRAGHLNLPASLNPYRDGYPEHASWERGRSGVIGAWLNGSLRKHG